MFYSVKEVCNANCISWRDLGWCLYLDYQWGTVVTVKAEHVSPDAEEKPESVHFLMGFFALSFLLSERKPGLCLGCEIP